uniref:mRNA-decapping enzyme-like protein n=1 Tax=Rhizophora mucronata TaxID=61149 RepID=A0A2P2LYU4_RHIMU
MKTENLVENLLGDFEYEVQTPYLLYRNAAQEVNGIWFYNLRECEEVANLFSRILNAYSKVPPKVKESSSKSEFEELEVVSSISIMEEPLEPPSTASATTNLPENSSFENFFNAAMNVGNDIANKANSRQPVVSLSSHTAIAVSTPMPTQQVSSIPLSSFPTSVPVHDSQKPIHRANQITNLVKPSSFSTTSSSSALLMPPVSSTMPTTPTLHPPLSLHRPYGTPLLQPFPPPAPPPSLTPSSTSQFLISRDKIQGALQMLVQDDQFVDMFHQALLKTHLS